MNWFSDGGMVSPDVTFVRSTAIHCNLIFFWLRSWSRLSRVYSFTIQHHWTFKASSLYVFKKILIFLIDYICMDYVMVSWIFEQSITDPESDELMNVGLLSNVDLEIRLILKGKQCNTEYVERIYCQGSICRGWVFNPLWCFSTPKFVLTPEKIVKISKIYIADPLWFSHKSSTEYC